MAHRNFARNYIIPTGFQGITVLQIGPQIRTGREKQNVRNSYLISRIGVGNQLQMNLYVIECRNFKYKWHVV